MSVFILTAIFFEPVNLCYSEFEGRCRLEDGLEALMVKQLFEHSGPVFERYGTRHDLLSVLWPR